MRERKPKPFQRQREESHWIGDDVSVQDALFSDLDPFSFAVDGAVAHSASQLAHLHQGSDERPIAVVVTPADGVPWHAGMLAKKFDTCILTPQPDPIIERIVERFNVSTFHGAVPAFLESRAQLVLITQDSWQDESELSESLDVAYQLLGTGGRALLILRAREVNGQTFIDWGGGGGAVALEAISALSRFKQWEWQTVRLADIAAQHDFGAGEFSKRHREFFGRYSRDLCLARLYEEDFQTLLRSSALAVLLTVQ